MTEFEIDWQREVRIGVAEALFCESKTAAQIDAILEAAADRPMLLTRLSETTLARLAEGHRARLDYDPLSRTAVFGRPSPKPIIVASDGGPGIVCAGTSDLPVAREVARTLAFHGIEAPIVADVGVAGLWRLLDKLETIRAFSPLIAVAGMEGALFSVLAGLTDAPVIAVPTDIGYGVAAGGRAALTGALASCAPGLMTVNIGNGYGAACAALKILKRHGAARPSADPKKAAGGRESGR